MAIKRGQVESESASEVLSRANGNGAKPSDSRTLAYWKREMEGASLRLELPTDKPRPVVQTLRGAMESFELPKDRLESLKRLSEKEQSTLFTTLAAGFMALIHRYAGQDDILTGTRVSGNTVALRAQFNEGISFRTLLQQMRERVADAHAHQDLPFDQLVAALAADQDASAAPVIQVMFLFNDEGGLQETENSGLDVTFSVTETQDGLAGSILYSADLFEADTIRRLWDSWTALLDGAVRDSEMTVAALPILSPQERQRIVTEWNNSILDFPVTTCIQELFEEQARKTPDAVALVFEGTSLSYDELNRQANRLAHHLQTLGVRPDSLVAICVERSLEMVVSLLGILKAGGAYVPLDPAYPAERLSYMLQDSAPAAVLTQTPLKGLLSEVSEAVPIVDLTDAEAAWKNEPDTNLDKAAIGLTPEHLAYVIYTSGSTGQPKGVCIEHRNIVNYVLGVAERLRLKPGMNAATVSTIAADLGNTVVFPALLTGGCLHVISQARAENQAMLSDYFVREHIDVLKIVPSHLAALQTGRNPERAMPAARLVLGGEASRLEWVESLRRLAPNCDVYNHYGPTETTVGVLTYATGSKLPNTVSGTLPLGRPLPNTRIYILDPQGQPTPIGVPGELCVGGRGVARGYLHRPDLTKERFVADPFSPEPNARLYHTGDRARYLADGNIEFLGRIDQQVKIHGYRIEPGEIEAVLREQPGVRDAVVLAREDEPGDKQLVAYVVPERAEQTLWDSKSLHVLPDGSVVAHLNKNETEYIYQEIFVLQAYIRHGITIRDGDCILDAGSNIGMFTVFANRLARDLRMVCFEPNLPVYECAKANATAYGTNVIVLPVGLSKTETTAEMTFFEGFSLLSGFYADEAVEREVVKNYALNQTASESDEKMAAEIGGLLEDRFRAKTVKAKLRTLSNVIAEQGIDRIDLLKVNVEKSELDVLQGIGEADWAKIRQLVIEVDQQQSVEPIVTLLEKHGYETLVEQDPLLRRTDLCYVYAIRPSAVGRLIREQGPEDHVRSLPSALGRVIAPVLLRKSLSARLPHYMVPAAFVLMEKLPLTPNGKLDRKALPAPSGSAIAATQKFEAPRTQTQKTLAAIWSDVLKTERIGMHDDFFELGGHSLTAIRAVAQIRDAFEIDLPTQTLFTHSTIAALAELVDKTESKRSAVSTKLPQVQADPANRYERFPLNHIQQAYLIGRSDVIELGNIPCRPYNEFEALDWDQERFETALDKLIQRHEMLRSIVFADGDQQILAEVPNYKVQTLDMRRLPQAEATAKLEAIREEMICTVPPTDEWPLFEIRASRLDDRHTRLHIKIDLLIADGRSFEIFFTELAQLYHNPELVLPPLDLSFRDYLTALNSTEQSSAYKEAEKYWMDRVSTLPSAPDVPLAKNPAAVEKPVFKRRSARMDAATWRNLREKGTRFHATPSGILLAAYAEVLSIWSKCPRFCVNLALFNRLPLHPQSNDIIGDFTSVNLLEIDNSTGESFVQRAQRQQEQLWNDLDHRLFSGIHVMRELRRLQSVGPKAIMPFVFTSLLNLDDQGDGTTWLSRLGEPGFAHTQTPQVYLDFIVQEDKGSLVLNWDAVDELFPQGMLDDMFQSFQRLLRELASEDTSWNHNLGENTRQLLPAEQMEIRKRVNTTQAPISSELLHNGFVQQVAARPEAMAVITPSKRLTYAETYGLACRVEQELLARGVEPNQVVGVLMDKGWEQIVAVLGIQFAGGAYLPIDSELPPERQRYLVENAGVKLVLTQSYLQGGMQAPEGVEFLTVDAMQPLEPVETTPRLRQKPEDLAYIIYTSGSTGSPKGVMIDHRGAMNTVLDVNARFGVEPSDRVLGLSRLNFDLSVYDIFGMLSAGGAVVLPAADLTQDPEHWAELLAAEKVTVWNTVPALMQLMAEEADHRGSISQSLRVVMMSGDWIPVNLPAHIRRILPEATIISMGGATEASIWSIIYPIENVDASWTSVPYGKPMVNQTFQVLNQVFAPCPVWVPGQLYIGGIGVAKGYFGDENKTKSSFITHPVSGEKLYRTGDLGRYLPDGNIEFLGREDLQVKIRGFRIELGEIEARLSGCAGVREASVIVREEPDGGKRLVAYYTAKETSQASPEQLRTDLATHLPEYMIPAAFVRLEKLPLTPNGKLDRKALPAPNASDGATVRQFLAPRTQTERALAAIWSEVLKVERIGVHDNFFDLGGHSMTAIRVVLRVRDLYKKPLSIERLFQAPTIAALGQVLQVDEPSAASSIQPRAERAAAAPLSFLQEQQWFLNQLAPDSPAYNVVDVIELGGTYNREALRGALQELARRHEILRTTFSYSNGQPVQIVMPGVEVPLKEVDLSGLAGAEREREWTRVIHEQGRTIFDFSHAPQFGGTLVRWSSTEQKLVVSIHHIIADEWSMELIQQEVTQLYRAFSQGLPSPLAELPIQYADFAYWQRESLQGEILDHQLAYWKEELAGAPQVLELATDKPRPAVQSFRGATEAFQLPPELVEPLKSLGRQEQATLFMVLQASFVAFLHRYTGQEDILVGTPVSRRTHAETEKLIGYFLNTLVLRAQFTEGLSFRELLQQVRKRALGAHAHADLPFNHLVTELAAQRNSSRTPLFQAMFILHDPDGVTQSSKSSGDHELETGTSKFDLTLAMSEGADSLQGMIEYSTDLFEPEIIRRMCKHFGTLVEAIAQDADRSISTLPMLMEEERRQLREWNDTEAPYPADVCLHELFERQAERTPHAVAVEFEGTRLTYAELNSRANQLARYLREAGVGPDTLVGVFMERSLEMVIALYGVLKAGGAYVPLDPSFPQSRLSYMVEDSRMRVLVTHHGLAEDLPIQPEVIVHLDSDESKIARCSADRLEGAGAGPGNRAYVLYTSGSTGKPKGVEIPQSAIVNFLMSMQREPGFKPEDILLAVTTLSFDIAGLELHLPLMTGGRVVIASREDAVDPARLMQRMEQTGCTVMQATPATWRSLIDAGWTGSSRLKVLCGGEAMLPDLAKQLLPRCAELWNMYGPTETTVWSTIHRVTSAEAPISIGHPIANTQVYVLDAHGNLVPPGNVGELYIGGDGLARGYLSRDELTQQRFVSSAFAPQARLYRTGDLARWRQDGTLECLGRADNQVKLRGFRIELGEIEAVLARHPEVKECVVTAREDTPGEKMLVGYIIPTASAVPEISDLRNQLKIDLPDYMIPSAFVMVEAFPLTPNGKIDRKSLPAPIERIGPSSQGFVGPRVETERLLAQIWMDAFHLKQVSVYDNFFDLGGHSLLAVRVVKDIAAATKIHIPLSTLLEAPTIADLSEILSFVMMDMEATA